jgi:hypothetical protein
MNSLIKDLIYQGYLKTDRIISAFSKSGGLISFRKIWKRGWANIPLPIGQDNDFPSRWLYAENRALPGTKF